MDAPQDDEPIVGARPGLGNPLVADRMRAQVEHALFGAPAPPLGVGTVPVATSGEIEVSTRSSTTPDPLADTPGVVTLGRFRIQGLLGRGGMGEVYAAFDPRLQRPVAIKVLRPFPADEAEHARRLRREAAAIARISHPNIVQVFDVGTIDGQVYVAMELVEGLSLRRWLSRTRRSREEILGVFRQAGRGLAAAHERGVVHRDFKPGNVLVGDDGRVRVIDFGLARRAQGVAPEPETRIASVGGAGVPSTAHRRAVGLGTITQSGRAVGTPGYMAPEQHAGQPAVAATDQYAFCVSLFEALTGIRPRALPSSNGLSVREVDIPPGLARVLDRGMAAAPEDRWPSMDALLDALDRSARRWRIPWRWVGAGLLAGLASVGAWAAARDSAVPARCGVPEASELWNEARRRAVTEGLARSGVEHATTSAGWVVPQLDRYAEDWNDTRSSLCDAGPVPTTVQACLRHRRVAVDATIDALASADRGLASRVPELLEGLPSVRGCLGTGPLSQTEPSQESLAEQLVALRLRLWGGSVDDLRGQAAQLVEQARQAGATSLTLEAELLHGHAAAARGRVDEAAARFEATYLEAHEAAYDRLAAEAAWHMTALIPEWSRDPGQGLRWAERACATLMRLGDPADEPRCAWARARAFVAQGHDDEAAEQLEQALTLLAAQGDGTAPLRARVGLALASVRRSQHQPDAAAHALDEARRLVSRSLGAHHPRYAEVLVGQAALHDELADYDRALGELDEALRLIDHSLGRHHPARTEALERRARILASRGRLAEATTLTEEILALRTATFGRGHVDVARTHYNLGLLLWGQGRDDEAMAALGRAKSIYYETYGPGRIEVAPILELQGHHAARVGDHAEALRVYDQALEIRREADGARHPSVGAVLDYRFEPLRALGRAEEAEDSARQGLEILEDALGPQHPRLVPPLVHLAQHHETAGRWEEAAAAYDRAIELGTAAWGDGSANLRELLVGRAEVAKAMGRVAEAEGWAERALALDGDGDPRGELESRARRVLGQEPSAALDQ